MLQIGMNLIFIACVFYTIGVWSEKIQKRLKLWHLTMFYLGLVCDTIGTGAMAKLSGGLLKFNFHGLTGIAAILLMLFHSVWATMVFFQRNEMKILKFHQFSLLVWIIWLIPMLSGMIYGVTR
jgi:uncharacterized repeat protein (TIGR03987 family)